MLIGFLLAGLLLGGCANASKSAKIGRLAIISEPASGADIYLNGHRQKLKTNAFFNLRPGLYAIKVVKAEEAGGEPLVGEASVAVKAGRASRAVVTLNKMKIVPAAAAGGLRPETRAQKTILDYYAALAEKDLQTAFAYLSRRGKWEAGGFWRFSKTAKETASVAVVSLELAGSDETKTTEVNQVGLDVLKVPTRKGPTPKTERVNVLITTVDELKGAGLLKIESIVEATATTENK